jgi:hypothetical protein
LYHLSSFRIAQYVRHKNAWGPQRLEQNNLQAPLGAQADGKTESALPRSYSPLSPVTLILFAAAGKILFTKRL